jgi:predicted transposase YdaD
LKGLIKGKAEGIAEGRTEGRTEGIAEGMEVGRETGARIQLEATVLRMHRHGMSLEGISEILGIERAEVEAILKKLIV